MARIEELFEPGKSHGAVGTDRSRPGAGDGGGAKISTFSVGVMYCL